MLRNFVIIFISCNALLPLKIFSQFDFTWSGGPTHLGLGRATVALEDEIGLFSNQAVLADTKGFGAEINALSKYGINGLNLLSAGVYKGSTNGTFMLSVHQYGLESYREQKFGFGYARALSDLIFASLQFNYFNLSVKEFGSLGRVGAELGIFTKISKNISMGMHIFSPSGQEVTEGYPLNTRLRIGPNIEIGNGINLFLELEKSLDFNPVIKSGIRYQFHQNLDILIGLIPTLSEYSFGFLYNVGSYIVKGAFTYDDILGVSPSFGLFYCNSK